MGRVNSVSVRATTYAQDIELPPGAKILSAQFTGDRDIISLFAWADWSLPPRRYRIVSCMTGGPGPDESAQIMWKFIATVNMNVPGRDYHLFLEVERDYPSAALL